MHKTRKIRNILIAVDSRANWTRCQTMCEAIQSNPSLRLSLVTIGPMSRTWATWFPPHLKPTNVLDTPLIDDSPLSMVASMSDIMEALRSCYRQLDPDLVIALTDRYETLAVASTAALMNIPIAHIQGGEVTGTIDESIRHSVTKLSHVHFVATEDARDRVIRMGEDSRYVFNVGCPASDLLLRVDVSTRVITDDYILVLMHPVTTEYGESYQQMDAVLRGVKAAWDGLIVVVGPNHDAGSHGIWKAIKESGLSAPNQVPFNEWVNLMAHAEVLVGNSSSGIREACYFGTPTVDIGTRQQGRKPRGQNVHHVSLGTNHDWEHIAFKVQTQLSMGRYAPEYLYGNGNAGVLIARILGEIELPPIQKRFID